MSPEQVRAQALDRRSDVWALGCVLYAALAGAEAFPGRTAGQRMRATLAGEPDWAALDLAATPPEVVLLVRRCLEKDRERRLADADQVRQGLERALALACEAPAPSEPRHNLPNPIGR